MGLSLKNVGKKIWDQVNVLDNGRSWGNQNPTTTDSAITQAANIGKSLIRSPVQFVNTGYQGLQGVGSLGRIGAASVFGSDQSYANTVRRETAGFNKAINPTSGLLGMGGFTKSPEELLNLTPKQIAGMSINEGSQIAGFFAPELKLLKNPVLNRLTNNAMQSSVGSVIGQGVENGKIDPRKVAMDTISGAAIGEILPTASYISKGTLSHLNGLGEGGFIAGPGARNFNEALYDGKAFKGPEGKARFEVDDSKAKIKNGITKAAFEKEMRLSDVLEHDLLYKEYPGLANVPIRLHERSADGVTQGSMGRNGIDLYVNGRSKSKVLETLIHEVQHGIQRKEGFAGGGGPDKISVANAINDRILNLIVDENGDRVTGATPAGRARLAEAQRLGDILKDPKKLDRAAYRAYQRLGGEAESRAVSARIMMTPEQRQQLSFYKSLDVPKNELTIPGSAPDVSSLNIENPSAIKFKDRTKPVVDKLPGVISDVTQKTITARTDSSKTTETIKPKVSRKVESSKTGYLKNDPSIVDRVARSTRGYIEQHGQGGKEISKKLRDARDSSEIGQEAFLESIPTVMDLNKKEFEQWVDELDARSRGKKTGLSNTKILNAVKEWNEAAPQLRDRGLSAGLSVGDRGPNYFPRIYKDLHKKNVMDKLAKEMVSSGDAKTYGEAIGKIRQMQRDYTKPYGNLEKNRTTNTPGYEKNQDALLSYISRSFDRITKAEQFGAKNEILNELRGKIQQEGYDTSKGSQFDKKLKIAIGDVDYNTTGHKVSRKIRGFNAARTLTVSAITNATQGVNTSTVAGITRTLNAVRKAITSGDERASAKESGVLLDHTIRALATQGTGVKSKILQNVASPLFNTIERFNRTYTAIAGKDLGNSLAKKAFNGNEKAQRILRDKLGIKGPIGEKLTRKQEIQASRALVEKTQFKVDPQDLPGWADSPYGQIATQLKKFGYKQTEFIYHEIVKEATKGNLSPLLRYVVAGSIAGMGSNALKDLIIPGGESVQAEDYNSPEKLAKKAGKGLLSTGAGGLPLSEALSFGRSVSYGDIPQAVGGAIGGPTGSYIGEGTTNISKAKEGNTKPIVKQAIKSVPGGKIVAPLVIPSKVTAESEAYFDRLSKAKKSLKSDKKATADLNSYLARSKNKQGGTIQLSPRQSIDNAGMLLGNDKLREAVKQLEVGDSKHDPLWDLPDDKIKSYLQYAAQYTGSDEKAFIREKNPWISDLQKKRDSFYSNIPKGDGPASQRHADRPVYPEFSDETNALLDAYENANTEERAAINQQYGGEISDAFNKIGEYTKAMRKAEGAPELKSYPVADAETKAIIDFYNTLPKGDGAKGGNATRFAWAQSHPQEFKKMQEYLAEASLSSLIKNAAKAQFKDSEVSQKLLKQIKNVGSYDIATSEDQQGNKIFSLDPTAAYAQRSAESSYTPNPAKFLGNIDQFRVSQPGGSIKNARSTVKVSLKKGKKVKISRKKSRKIRAKV